MTKRLVSAAMGVAAIGAAALAIAPAAMAYNGGTCTIQGTANFSSPGLTLGPGASPFTYTFNGKLSNCETGNSSSGPGAQGLTGTIYTPDPATGSGSCASSTTSGVAVVDWSDGKTTVETYTTTGYAAGVVQQGSIVAKYTSTTQKDSLGNPIVYTTTEPATPVGDSGYGLFAFQPPSPTSCQTGVTTAGISGQIFTGGSA